MTNDHFNFEVLTEQFLKQFFWIHNINFHVQPIRRVNMTVKVTSKTFIRKTKRGNILKVSVDIAVRVRILRKFGAKLIRILLPFIDEFWCA